jgi:hypothetical protein
MSTRLHRYLMVVALAALGRTSSAQDIHIVLRAKDGKTWFHLGEPITLEAACIDQTTQRYLLPCSVVLKAEAISLGTRLSADRIDQMTWLDAQSGSLPPQPRGQCGNTDNHLPSQQTKVPAWEEVTLEEPVPVYVGRYRVRANLAFDLEIADRFGDKTGHSASDEVEIGLDDNLAWKNRLIHFRGCEYNVQLTLVPDEEAITALRKRLNDCARTLAEPYAGLLHEIVWLKMQVEQPDLYMRMLELERTRLPFREEADADLQKAELAQARLGAAGDASRIRQWFDDQYRELLLETAQQLVLRYRSHPELHGDEDFQGDLEDGFENWHDAAASLFGGADSYVSRDEVINFLKRAGRPQKYIAIFLKDQKSDLPLSLPEYHN